jgi:tetratricopeptide (TPR) repeat protein
LRRHLHRNLHRLGAEPHLRRRWITAVIGLVLTMFPLIGTLGYEHAFVLGPLAALGGIAVGVDTVRAARTKGGATVRELIAAGFAEIAVLCAIAIAVPIVGQLWRPSCDPYGGIVFFLIGPAICACIGVVAGFWGGVLGTTRSRQLALGMVPMLVSTAIGLWRLYAEPVVFAYDPFFGYFSGSIYDEAVAVGPMYLAFRAYNALWVGAALLALHAWATPELRTRSPRLRRHRLFEELAPWFLMLPALGIGLRASKLGFTADFVSVTDALSGTMTTEHFVLHYMPRSADAREIAAIAREHEFAWAELKAQMNGREPDDKVHSFLFATPEQKRRLMGAGTAQIAAPWRQQIYLDHRPFPHPVLHHELAHVFGKTIGDPVLGISRSGLRINIGLIEGFATAMAPRESDRLDLHDQAAVLERLGKRPPMALIMGPGFFTRSSSVAYTAAGSFCLWLVETRGFEPMATLYRNAGDFDAAYGESLADLEVQWLEFLAAREGPTDADVAAETQRFKRTSVFERPCAHRAADVRTQIERANIKGELEDAIIGWRELCAIEPETPEHTLGLGHALAVAGRYDEAGQVFADAATAPELATTQLAAIAERQGDVALLLGDLAAARAAYERALAQPQSEARRRVLQLRREAAEDPELARLVLAYLSPFDATGNEEVRAVRAAHAAAEIARRPGYRSLGDYLLARQLLNVQEHAAAVPLLERSLAPQGDERALPSLEYLRAAHLALVSALLQGDRFADAQRVLTALEQLPDAGNGHVQAWHEWQRRIEFCATYPGP